MKNFNRNHLLKWNTLLWLLAMVLPAGFSIALEGTRFPWQILVPFLLLGPMLASNKMLIAATEESAGASRA